MAQYPKGNNYDPKFPVKNLQPHKFNALIASQGVRISVEKSMLCPNIVGRLETGEHNINCEICDNGFVYYDKNEIWAVHQQNQLREYFRINGLWEANTTMLSTPTKLDDNVTELLIHRFDRIVLLDFTVRISERLEREDASPTDKLKYKALLIERVSTKLNDTTEKVFVQDTDYQLEPDNGDIEWIGANKPADFGVYTVSYHYNPVYLVEALLHEGRYSLDTFKKAYKEPARLPQMILLKRDYLFDKRDDTTEAILREPIRYL